MNKDKGLHSGVLTQAGGIVYSGAFDKGQYQGHGLLETDTGQCYQGEFSQGQVHGWGVRFFADGTKAAGESS